MLKSVKDQTASALSIPKDVIPGEPMVTMTGRQKVYIENYHRIVSFQDEEIKLQAKTCRILVHGKRLRIEYYTRDDMLIAGQIHSVSMEG
ncbi:MAG: sporulation protein [Hungatella sp.]|nr:sporulation protein [Hungatella sp.]